MSMRKLSTLLLFAVIAILLISDLVCYFGIEKQKTLSSQAGTVTQQQTLSAELELGLEQQNSAVRAFILSGDPKFKVRDHEGSEHFIEALDHFKQLSTSEEGKAIVAEIEAGYPPIRANLDQMLQLNQQGHKEEAAKLLSDPAVGKTRSLLKNQLADFDKLQVTRKNAALAALQKSQQFSQYLTMLLCVPAIVLAALIWRVSAIAVRRETEEMRAMIKKMANGELDVSDARVIGKDEMSEAVGLLNEMKNKFQLLLQGISSSAEDIARTGGEISSSASQQAHSAEDQRLQSQQVASTMHQMNASVREVAESTANVARTSDEATEIARKGGAIVEQAQAAMRSISASVHTTATKMEELGESSQRIGEITKVIDEIAQQTNLLALNAAIEAARAGDAGRGFAVVAGEVRRLAERTAQATREIAGMVVAIQNGTGAAMASMSTGRSEVERGVDTTAQAGESLARIIASVEDVSRMVSQIAAATTQQSAAVGEVAISIQKISSLVEESSQSANETDRACRGLNELSSTLQTSVAVFRI